MKARCIILLFIFSYAVMMLHAQTTPGLTPGQVKKLQDYAMQKGLKADFSKAFVDSLEYETVERRIDSIALLPNHMLKDWEFIFKERDYFLLMQATQFTKKSTPVLKKDGTGIEAFLFRSYLLSDTVKVFDMFSPEVKKEMRAVRVLKSWTVSQLEEEYRGKGLNPYNQSMIKVLSRILGQDLVVDEEPDENKVTLTYRSQPLYLILDDLNHIESASRGYAMDYLDEADMESAPDLKKSLLYPEYALPMFCYSLDYTLKNLRWIILADVEGDFALLLISSEIPRVRLPGEENNAR